MRVMLAVLTAAIVLWPAGAGAYENFIPMGHGYALNDAQLPALNSTQDKFSAQVDIYETELYVRQRAQRAFDTQLNMFKNSQEFKGGGDFIDY